MWDEPRPNVREALATCHRRVPPAKNSGEFALAVALRYLRALTLEGKPDQGAVRCFDGENQAVPRERILGVEFV